MNLPSPSNWDTPQRQARAGLLIILSKSIVSIIKSLWPILLVVLLNKKGKVSHFSDILLLCISSFMLVRSVIDFFYFRFYILNNELVVKEGFISRKTLAIPLEKIQAVHIEQHLLHQLLNIVQVKIDTAGSERGEIVIDALGITKAERFKSYLLHEQQLLSEETATPAPPKEISFIRLSMADLIKMGISANHFRALFVMLSFASSIFLEMQDVWEKKLVRASHNSSSISMSVTYLILFIVGIFFVLVLISFGKVFLNYYNFNLIETSQGFLLKTGLIHAKQYLVRFSKIQFISWEANWLHRKLGLYHLEFHQASGDHRHRNRHNRVSVPISQAIYIENIADHYHEQLPGKEDSIHALHKAYPFRRTLLIAILPVGLPLLIIQLLFFNPWFFLPALWIPYVFITAVFFRKNFRLYISPDAFQVNSGVWGRRTKIVKWYKIQGVLLQQSIYQRHKQLASLKLSTAGGNIHIPYISLELAQMIQNYALYKVERSNEAWM